MDRKIAVIGSKMDSVAPRKFQSFQVENDVELVESQEDSDPNVISEKLKLLVEKYNSPLSKSGSSRGDNPIYYSKKKYKKSFNKR